MYTFHSRVRYSETGSNGIMTMHGILNYFQDCSTFQSEALGLGVDVLKQRHRAWLLTAWQVEVLRAPVFGEEIEIGTFPYAFKGFFGLRNFLIRDSQGNTLVRANSVWVYVNTDTGHPARALPEEISAYSLEPKLDMDYRDRKVRIPEHAVFADLEPFPVQKHQIDTNHHVNNSQYPLMAWEYLPDGFCCGYMQAEYKTAARPGDLICPSVWNDQGTYWVILADTAGNPYVIVRAEEKQS